MIYMNAIVAQVIGNKNGNKDDYDKIMFLRKMLENNISYVKLNKEKNKTEKKGKKPISFCIRKNFIDGDLQMIYPYGNKQELKISYIYCDSERIKTEMYPCEVSEEILIEAIIRTVLLSNQKVSDIKINDFIDKFKSEIEKTSRVEIENVDCLKNAPKDYIENIVANYIYDGIKNMHDINGFDLVYENCLSEILFYKYAGEDEKSVLLDVFKKSKLVATIENGMEYHLKKEKEIINNYYGIDFEPKKIKREKVKEIDEK